MSADEGEELTGSHRKNWVDNDAKIPQGNSEGSMRKTFFRCMDMQKAYHSLTGFLNVSWIKVSISLFLFGPTSTYTAGFQVC